MPPARLAASGNDVAPAALPHAKLDFSSLIPVMILAGGAINGFVVLIMDAVRINGTEQLLFGISPFELIAVAVAMYLLISSASQTDYKPGWLEGLIVLALMIPSSLVSWTATALYAGILSTRLQGDGRIGSVLFLALALSAIWSSLFMNWLAAPITTVEAHIVTALLALVKAGVSVSSNLMGVIGGHQVLLLPACASAYLIPKAIVAFAALTIFMGSDRSLKTLAKIAITAVLVLAFTNWIRIAIMTWSKPMYDLAHGPIGANIFDLSQTAIIILAALWASR